MLMNALASLSRWSFATDSRKPSHECPRRVLHMQRVPEIQHAWKSNDSCFQSALITRSSWNRSFLANAPHEKPAAMVYRTGGSRLLQRLHSPGHSLSTECPSRRVCHCSSRFLTIHFLGHREARCTHCKRPIIKRSWLKMIEYFRCASRFPSVPLIKNVRKIKIRFCHEKIWSNDTYCYRWSIFVLKN